LADDLIKEMIQREIDLGYGDSRLQFILNWVKSGRPLFETDKIYLEKRLAHYPKRGTNHEEEFEGPITARLEHQVNRMGEMMRVEQESFADLQGHQTSISDISDPTHDSAKRHVRELVEMKKNLHRILVKLDSLEEKSRQEAYYQEPNYETSLYEKSSASYKPGRKSIEKEETYQKSKEIQNDGRGMRAFAVVLFAFTVLIMAASFAALVVFGTPFGREKLTEFGITSDQIQTLMGLIVPALNLNLGAWIIFGLLYIQKSRSNKY
jgi:hypothetical protein